MISRKKNWQYYSRASFKCILEEEQRVVWREFFSLRQVKRSKQSFHSVQPKPNVWADLAKIPHAFGTVLHTTYYTPDTRCVLVSVCSATAAMPSSSFTSSRPGLLLWFRSAKTEFLWPTCWGHLCKSKLSKKNSSNWFTNNYFKQKTILYIRYFLSL